MSKKGFHSRALRQLAKELLDDIGQDEEVCEEEREDYATSLVRQWITYDGNAMLLFEDQVIYLVIGKNPDGQLSVTPQAGTEGWMKILREDWKIDPDAFPDICGQLNRGQSVEVTNTEGIPLRLWVNPKERSQGVEPLVKTQIPRGFKRDYHKLAVKQLEHQFSSTLQAEEIEVLSYSLVKQWEKYEGNACVFLDGEWQFSFKVTEKEDGCCTISVARRNSRLDPLLASLGFAPEEIPDVIARINLGQEVEFPDRKGIPSLLWHDPKERQIMVRPLNPVPATVPQGELPIFCPKCSAVLRLWTGIERQQACPLCGHSVSLEW